MGLARQSRAIKMEVLSGELVYKIFDLLPRKDQISFGRVCKDYLSLLRNDRRFIRAMNFRGKIDLEHRLMQKESFCSMGNYGMTVDALNNEIIAIGPNIAFFFDVFTMEPKRQIMLPPNSNRVPYRFFVFNLNTQHFIAQGNDLNIYVFDNNFNVLRNITSHNRNNILLSLVPWCANDDLVLCTNAIQNRVGFINFSRPHEDPPRIFCKQGLIYAVATDVANMRILVFLKDQDDAKERILLYDKRFCCFSAVIPRMDGDPYKSWHWPNGTLQNVIIDGNGIIFLIGQRNMRMLDSKFNLLPIHPYEFRTFNPTHCTIDAHGTIYLGYNNTGQLIRISNHTNGALRKKKRRLQ